VLATLDADLVVEGPDELRRRVSALAQRLFAACGDEADASHQMLPRHRSEG